MSSFDLVPRDYRVQLAQQQLLRQFGGLLAALGLLLLACYLGLRWLHSNHQAQLDALQAKQVIKQQEISTYQSLRHEQSNLKSQVEQLAQFQGSGSTHRLLSSVEAAAQQGNVWLTHWRYTRETSARPHQVELHGDALDHGALSDFVQQLLRSPEILDASITRSTLKADRSGNRNGQESRKITFRLDVQVLNAATNLQAAASQPLRSNS